MSYFVKDPGAPQQTPKVFTGKCKEPGCDGETELKDGVRTCKKCGEWSFIPIPGEYLV